MPFTSYAQNFEDVLLWRALNDVAGGFYIDVGAWDPDHDSVTRAFSERGWHGINIEPVATWHERLSIRRPRDINLHAAIGTTRSRSAFFEVPATGLSTTNAELATTHEAHGWSVVKQEVEVIPLAEICEAHAPPAIHFLKIDCEGDEYAALAGADFSRFRPWIILLEAVHPVDQAPTHGPWEPLLTAADYRFVWFDGLNRFYVAAEHYDRLAARLAMPPNVFDQFVVAGAGAPAAPPPVPVPSVDPFVTQTPAQLTPDERIVLTQRCRDCDDIPKVAEAGRIQIEPDGTRVQIMHNGLKVPADGYCGPWMTRLIELCQGHHEPQEERLFHAVVQALPRDATMIELGGHWAFYSAWFLQGAPDRRAVVLEPDPAHRSVGERTMELNGLHASFVAGFAGASPLPATPFATEQSGTLDLSCYDVPQLLSDHRMERVDLLHCDIQGAEYAVLEGCRDLLRTGRVGFVFVSTHVHQISGDPLTHQRCLALLRDCGAVIEAEHDPYESFSGDGLIVARVVAAPPGWKPVPISLARTGKTLFRHPSFDLAEALQQFRDTRRIANLFVSGAVGSLLFRSVSEADLQVVHQEICHDGDYSHLLRLILQSPEFVSKQQEFGATYFHEQKLPFLPADGLFDCAAVHLKLRCDGPLGRAGEALVLPNDKTITPAAIAAGGWNVQQTEFLAERIDPAGRYVVLDVGANIGLFTRQVLKAFPGRIVACHCIEPDPDNYAILCLNLAGSRDAAIHTYPIALGTANGDLAFYRDAENCGNYSLLPDAMRDRPFTQSAVPVAAAGPWLEQVVASNEAILWKSNTRGSDESIIAAATWPLWQRVTAAIVDLWRIRKTGEALPGFLEKVADMPNRQMDGKPVSVDDVARYLEGDDRARADLYLWR
jgi:FkbM family methyltransferase